jgi:hypothetical protein
MKFFAWLDWAVAHFPYSGCQGNGSMHSDWENHLVNRSQAFQWGPRPTAPVGTGPRNSRMNCEFGLHLGAAGYSEYQELA